jgi:hypothetical protein
MRCYHRLGLVFLTIISAFGAVQLVSPAQSPKEPADRFEFQIVESFDAKYLGDTPGHTGRGGGLGSSRPNVALGDPVFHGDTKIGTITNLRWDRTKDSLEVEFDPEPFQRILIGEAVWISLRGQGGTNPRK